MSTATNNLDDYQLHNLIAMGSQSQIWEASLQGTSERVAIKLMLPVPFKDPEQLTSFKYEAKIMGSLTHPNIIKFIKFAKTKTNAYIVMELFRSPSLRTYLSNDLVTLQARFKRLMELVCMSISYLHEKGLVHKDIKPENILLSKGSEVRLIDFALCTKYATGMAKMFAGKPKAIQGTRSYLAPETIRKEAPSPQTDIYSLGVVFFEILVGKTPFQGTSPTDLLRKHLTEKPVPPSEINTNVTKEVDRCIMRMLAKKSKDRHKTMQEVFSELRNVSIFKEDVQDRQARLKTTNAEELFSGLQRKLDSRADADRMDQIKINPELANKYIKSSVGNLKTARTNYTEDEPAVPAVPAAAPMDPSAGGFPPGYQQQPMPPGYPYPMMMPPGMPNQPMPYPGQYYPPQGMPPGYPYPNAQYPGMYPGQQPYPPMPYPPGTVPPGYPQEVSAAVTPVAPQGTMPPVATTPPVPPAKAPAPAAPVQKKSQSGHVRIDSTSEVDLDSIPVMDELPDIE
ncbi:MAG: serine/threonine protein kinase [Planctomycetaceae bacterium]